MGRPTLGRPLPFFFFLATTREGAYLLFLRKKEDGVASFGVWRVFTEKRVGREELIITWGGLVWIFVLF